MSPRIHAAFARQTGEAVDYDRVDALPGRFADAVRAFARAGGCGLNVTLPFKVEAWQLSRQRTVRAERAGAVNTLRFDADGMHGENTDGIGLVRDLQRLCLRNGLDASVADVAVLGAGGAARGIIGPLLDLGSRSLTIVNRTSARAQELAQVFGTPGRSIAALAWEEMATQRFTWIINATSAALEGKRLDLPPAIFDGAILAYDLLYVPASSSASTSFLEAAASHGVEVCSDGLGMLIEQAAESFYFWRGVRPLTDPVRALLEAVSPQH